MKRIPQNTAVETLCYVLSPTQKIIVIDRQNMYDTGKEVFNGTQNDLNSYEYARISKSKIRSVSTQDDTLIITIETSNDEY